MPGSEASSEDSSGPYDDVAAGRSRDIDISPDELAAYEHVLLSDTWSLESIGAVLGGDVDGVDGVDRASVALAALVRRKLLEPSQQHDNRLVPSSPRVGLGQVASAVEQDLLERTQYAHDLRMLTDSLVERFEKRRTARSSEGFELLHGRDATVARVSELLRDARSSVDTVVTTSPTERALEQARIGDLTLLERGVAARGLYLESHRRRSPQLRAHLSWLSGLGAQVRVAGMLPGRFMVIDRSVAAVSVRAEDSSSGAVIVHTEGLVHLTTALFEMVWGSAVDVADGDAGARRPTEGRAEGLDLSELDRTVLHLMSRGNKDLAISRQTGLSVRSVRRVVATLSEQVGATSRFELALKCRELGLIQPRD